MRVVISRGALVACVVAGCGEPARRVTLEPTDHECGRPSGATAIRVIAYATGGEVVRSLGIDEQLDISDFPSDTQQLGVEVIVGGGQLGAIGKTSPIDLDRLDDGAVVPVFMAPPNGVCPTRTTMVAPRDQPVVARAGDRVLVIGGRDAAGAWLTSAEVYDPATASFSPIDVPEVLGAEGFAGTAAASLPDGNLVLTGGPQPVLTTFDVGTQRFLDSLLIESRAFHAAIALADGRVLVAGGCSDVDVGTCAGVVRRSTRIYDLANVQDDVPGPTLQSGRIGARLFDAGTREDGARALVIAGGTAPPGGALGAERFAIEDGGAEAIASTFAEAAALDGGGILTAFASAGSPPDGAASVVVPGRADAVPVSRAPDVEGAGLAKLEDGRVLAVGGTLASDLLLYDPTLDRWQRVSPPFGIEPTTDPELVPLADGSVLVLGGRGLDGRPSARAWVVRTSLVGATSGSITVVPAGSTSAVLTPVDPAAVSRAPWELSAITGLSRALVGGPRMANGVVQATVRSSAGGVALIAQHDGPGAELAVELEPGSPARLVRRAGGASRTLCEGRVVDEFPGDVGTTARLEVRAGQARARIGATLVIDCAADTGAVGAWGVAAMGAGARLIVDVVSLTR